MKNIGIVSSLILGVVFSSYGQTNKIENTGNVGIGTINPSSMLHLKDPAGGAALKIERGGKLWDFSIQNTGDNLYLNNSENTSSFFTFRKDGRFGIGTTSPTAELEVKSVTNNNAEIHINSSTDGNSSIIRFQDAGQDSWGLLSNYPTVGKFSLYNYNNNSISMLADTNGNIGIGTTNPDAKLRVQGTHSLGRFYTDTDGRFEIQATRSSSTALNTDLVLSSQQHIVLDPNPHGTAGNVGIGTYTPDAKLAVNGNIHTKEVKVDLIGWPDYVFESNYNLPTLQEVENHITKKGHLKNIPSAVEVSKNGIQLGKMNAKLLQKIEELTLYMIAQNKKTEKLIKEVEILKQKNEALEKKIK